MVAWRGWGKNGESPRGTRGNFRAAIYFYMTVMRRPAGGGRGVAMLIVVQMG